ncbi:MAG: hypothetical protein HY820_28395 [Acidobacteria bacterium]|nr:hypothetical protein [Acidobacteriota bacterium]
MPDTANIVINAYDGSRRLFPSTIKWTVKASDGRPLAARKTTEFRMKTGSSVVTVPFFDNFGDRYTVLASGIKGYDDSAWYPVDVSDKKPVTLDLLFLPKNGTLQFANATWSKLRTARPALADMIVRGCESATAAEEKYGQVIESRPESLACFLNVMTAVADIRLPSGKSPADYYWNSAWPQGDPKDAAWARSLDSVMTQDRFFCYVQETILDDVRAAAGHGFSKESNPEAWGHIGATESYKQNQFDVANVQLTFHGRDTTTFADANGVPVKCVKIEPDIDYYRDTAAHALLEVIPHWLTKGKTDPVTACALRWMAAKREGVADFDPLFTIEPA